MLKHKRKEAQIIIIFDDILPCPKCIVSIRQKNMNKDKFAVKYTRLSWFLAFTSQICNIEYFAA
jgi:hypothetical protein